MVELVISMCEREINHEYLDLKEHKKRIESLRGRPFEAIKFAEELYHIWRNDLEKGIDYASIIGIEDERGFQYTILERLGNDRFGSVFKATKDTGDS